MKNLSEVKQIRVRAVAAVVMVTGLWVEFDGPKRFEKLRMLKKKKKKVF